MLSWTSNSQCTNLVDPNNQKRCCILTGVKVIKISSGVFSKGEGKKTNPIHKFQETGPIENWLIIGGWLYYEDYQFQGCQRGIRHTPVITCYLVCRL